MKSPQIAIWYSVRAEYIEAMIKFRDIFLAGFLLEKFK